MHNLAILCTVLATIAGLSTVLAVSLRYHFEEIDRRQRHDYKETYGFEEIKRTHAPVYIEEERPNAGPIQVYPTQKEAQR